MDWNKHNGTNKLKYSNFLSYKHSAFTVTISVSALNNTSSLFTRPDIFGSDNREFNSTFHLY